MYTKILAAAVLSLGLGTAAIAQTDDSTDNVDTNSVSPADGEGEMGTSRTFNWDETVSGAFFTDPEMTTMRTEEEMSTNFDSLSEEQQAMVREDCADTGAVEQQTIDGIQQICEFVNQR